MGWRGRVPQVARWGIWAGADDVARVHAWGRRYGGLC